LEEPRTAAERPHGRRKLSATIEEHLLSGKGDASSSIWLGPRADPSCDRQDRCL